MPEDTEDLIPPKAGFSSWLSQLADPKVAVAFIGGGATIAAAFIAASAPNDKTLCRINTKQAETAMNNVDLYVRNQKLYGDGLALNFTGVAQRRYTEIVEDFSKMNQSKISESMKNRGKSLMPYEKSYTSIEVLDLLRPLLEEFKPPRDENLSRSIFDATEGVRQMYNTCPR